MEGKLNSKTIIMIIHNSFVMYNSFTGKLIPSSFHWYIYIVYLVIRTIIIVRLLFNTLRCTRGVNIAFDRYKSRERTAANVISISIKDHFTSRSSFPFFLSFFLSLPYFLQITNKKEFTIRIDKHSRIWIII